VTDQYGSAEMVAFVAQCEYGTYHVWPSFGTVELLVDGRAALPGETGELVCTGYINPAMPLLRYRTGDLAVAGDGCSCGSPFQALLSIEGRMDDIIITPDGRRVGRLDPVFKGVPDNAFMEAQIVQETIERIVLRYVKGSRYSETALETVRDNLQNRLGPRMQIDTEEVAALPRGSNGKLKAVWNKIVHADAMSKGVGREESPLRVSCDKR
jgi:phenylacetate-CoA ligase